MHYLFASWPVIASTVAYYTVNFGCNDNNFVKTIFGVILAFAPIQQQDNGRNTNIIIRENHILHVKIGYLLVVPSHEGKKRQVHDQKGMRVITHEIRVL